MCVLHTAEFLFSTQKNREEKRNLQQKRERKPLDFFKVGGGSFFLFFIYLFFFFWGPAPTWALNNSRQGPNSFAFENSLSVDQVQNQLIHKHFVSDLNFPLSFDRETVLYDANLLYHTYLNMFHLQL